MILIADTSGERLDAFLARAVPDLTRSAAQKLIEEGNVLRGGKKAKKNDKLNIGDEISVTIPEPKEVDIEAKDIPLDIVYEDDDVVVINKPKGLVVHPAAGHQDDTLVNGLLYAMGDSLSGINGELRPGIVHRIDKDTSGLLAVAKNDLAHTVLASQLKDLRQSEGRFRHGGCAHRPPSDGPQENVRDPAQFQGSSDPLGSGGPLPWLYPYSL